MLHAHRLPEASMEPLARKASNLINHSKEQHLLMLLSPSMLGSKLILLPRMWRNTIELLRHNMSGWCNQLDHSWSSCSIDVHKVMFYKFSILDAHVRGVTYVGLSNLCCVAYTPGCEVFQQQANKEPWRASMRPLYFWISGTDMKMKTTTITTMLNQP